MRYGIIGEEDEDRFLSLSRPLHYSDGIEPTELYVCFLDFITNCQLRRPRFPLRSEVERANATRLAGLPGPSNTYEALDIPGWDSRGNRLTRERTERLCDRLVALKRITLKVRSDDSWLVK